MMALRAARVARLWAAGADFIRTYLLASIIHDINLFLFCER